MNLKEAFTHQNYYDGLLAETQSYLSGNSTYKKIFRHLRNVVNPEASEVIKEEPQEEKLPYDVEFVVSFANDVIKEKELLYEAIRKAKATAELDIDAGISLNKARQGLAKTLQAMAGKKEYITTSTGRDYKFNVDGEQVPYVYEIQEQLSLEYDRKKIKSKSKELRAISDEVSRGIDLLNVTLQVEYEPVYTLDMDLEECLERFSSR